MAVRGQPYNAAAQESGSGGVRDRLAQAIVEQPDVGRFQLNPIIADPYPKPRGDLAPNPDFNNPIFNQPTGRVLNRDEESPLDPVPIPQPDPRFANNVPDPTPLRPPPQFPVQQQRSQPQQLTRPSQPPPPQQPAPPSLIDTFNPFARIGPINPVPGPTGNFFTADLGSASGPYGSQFRGEMPQNRTVGANYNGPLVDRFGNPRFGGRGRV